MSTNSTKLLYMQDSQQLTCKAKIINILKEDDKEILILDQTVFYPQGGGQPYDNGFIKSESGKFIIEEVRFFEGIIKHSGTFKAGTFEKGEIVHCFVDEQRRKTNSKLHSAGHLIDLAIKELNFDWIPTKGYHFPQGPNVEYEGDIKDIVKEKLKTEIENKCNELIKSDIEVKTSFVTKDELEKMCDFVPEYIPQDKPTRIVSLKNFNAPCGGTHVKNLSEIKGIKIRKIKIKKGIIKISYEIE